MIELLIAFTLTGATVSWQQPQTGHTCLYIYHAGATWPAGVCYGVIAEGTTQTVSLPGILQHEAYKIRPGDRLELRIDNVVVGEALVEGTQVFRAYLPSIHKSAPPVQRAVYLAWVGR